VRTAANELNLRSGPSSPAIFSLPGPQSSTPPTARAPLDQAAAAQTLKADRHPRIQFTFLGFTFRPRHAKGRDGKCWTNFLPAVSAAAMKRMYQRIREWHLPRQTSVGPCISVPIIARTQLRGASFQL
jgi:hypothetical protein